MNRFFLLINSNSTNSDVRCPFLIESGRTGWLQYWKSFFRYCFDVVGSLAPLNSIHWKEKSVSAKVQKLMICHRQILYFRSNCNIRTGWLQNWKSFSHYCFDVDVPLRSLKPVLWKRKSVSAKVQKVMVCRH